MNTRRRPPAQRGWGFWLLKMLLMLAVGGVAFLIGLLSTR